MSVSQIIDSPEYCITKTTNVFHKIFMIQIKKTLKS